MSTYASGLDWDGRLGLRSIGTGREGWHLGLSVDGTDGPAGAGPRLCVRLAAQGTPSLEGDFMGVSGLDLGTTRVSGLDLGTLFDTLGLDLGTC